MIDVLISEIVTIVVIGGGLLEGVIKAEKSHKTIMGKIDAVAGDLAKHISTVEKLGKDVSTVVEQVKSKDTTDTKPKA